MKCQNPSPPLLILTSLMERVDVAEALHVPVPRVIDSLVGDQVKYLY